MKYFLLMIVAILLTMCGQEDSGCCASLDVDIDISVASAEGIDLLDQNQMDAIRIG